jgi:hypothetical protein
MKNSITLTEISSGAIKEYNEQVEAIRHQIMKLVCDGYKLPTPDVTCEQGANDTIIANISMVWPQEVIEISIDIPKAKIKPRWRRVKPGVWVKWSGWYARDVETLDVYPVLWQMVNRGTCYYYSHHLYVLIGNKTHPVRFMRFKRKFSRDCAENQSLPDVPGFEIYKEE